MNDSNTDLIPVLNVAEGQIKWAILERHLAKPLPSGYCTFEVLLNGIRKEYTVFREQANQVAIDLVTKFASDCHLPTITLKTVSIPVAMEWRP